MAIVGGFSQLFIFDEEVRYQIPLLLHFVLDSMTKPPVLLAIYHHATGIDGLLICVVLAFVFLQWISLVFVVLGAVGGYIFAARDERYRGDLEGILFHPPTQWYMAIGAWLGLAHGFVCSSLRT